MLTQAQRDRGLLRLLDEEDRRGLEEEVDAFIRAEVPAPTPYDLKIAAERFDCRAPTLPAERALVARWFAAILRSRAAEMLAS